MEMMPVPGAGSLCVALAAAAAAPAPSSATSKTATPRTPRGSRGFWEGRAPRLSSAQCEIGTLWAFPTAALESQAVGLGRWFKIHPAMGTREWGTWAEPGAGGSKIIH